MQSGFNPVTGSAELEFIGRKPERILNLLTQKEIAFTKARKTSESVLEINVAKKHLSEVKEAGKEAGLKIEVKSQNGLLYFMRRFKKRYLLLTVPIVSIFAAFYLSFFIWEIEVTGNKTVTTGEILSELENAGVGIGTFGIGIDQELLRSKVMYEIEKLSFLTVNVYGCRAEVIVRERTEKPEIINEKTPTEVKAAKTGLITEMIVFAGKPEYKAGDTVLMGETLISGLLDSRSSGTRYVHAMGEVFARTWYEISASIPLEYITKSYTGKNIEKKALIVGKKRLNLYFNAGNLPIECDKITKTERLSAGGFELPVSVESAVYREYVPQKFELPEEEAETILKQKLLYSLDRVKKDAKLTMSRFESKLEDGVLTVTLNAECREQIALVTPISGD